MNNKKRKCESDTNMNIDMNVDMNVDVNVDMNVEKMIYQLNQMVIDIDKKLNYLNQSIQTQTQAQKQKEDNNEKFYSYLL